MKAPPFRYHAPQQLSDALSLLAQLPNARVLAGGQSLMPMLNLRVAGPDHLIDLNQIAELRQLTLTEDQLITGAMCTQRSIEHSDIVATHCPLLHQAILHVGHQQTRNRGTIGGSISHLDPGAELPVAAAALNAQIEIASNTSKRCIPFADFAQSYLTNCLEPDEMVTRIHWPKAASGSGASFHEFNRRPADFAIVSAAVQISVNEQGGIEQASIAVGGIQAVPLVISGQTLLGKTEISPRAGQDLVSDIQCDGDELYPPEFRQDVAGVLLQRALSESLEQARRTDNV